MSLASKPRTFAITVGTTAVRLLTSNIKRKAFLIYNNGTATVYLISEQTLPAAKGIPIPAGASYNNDTCFGEYWIISESAGQDVRVEEDAE